MDELVFFLDIDKCAIYGKAFHLAPRRPLCSPALPYLSHVEALQHGAPQKPTRARNVIFGGGMCSVGCCVRQVKTETTWRLPCSGCRGPPRRSVGSTAACSTPSWAVCFARCRALALTTAAECRLCLGEIRDLARRRAVQPGAGLGVCQEEIAAEESG